MEDNLTSADPLSYTTSESRVDQGVIVSRLEVPGSILSLMKNLRVDYNGQNRKHPLHFFFLYLHLKIV